MWFCTVHTASKEHALRQGFWQVWFMQLKEAWQSSSMLHSGWQFGGRPAGIVGNFHYEETWMSTEVWVVVLLRIFFTNVGRLAATLWIVSGWVFGTNRVGSTWGRVAKGSTSTPWRLSLETLLASENNAYESFTNEKTPFIHLYRVCTKQLSFSLGKQIPARERISCPCVGHRITNAVHAAWIRLAYILISPQIGIVIIVVNNTTVFVPII